MNRSNNAQHLTGGTYLTFRMKCVYLTLLVFLYPADLTSSNFMAHVYAGSGNTNMGISASVPNRCTFTGGSNITVDFGSYNVTTSSSEFTVTANFDVRCTKNAVAEITINNGSHANGTQRRMTDGFGNYLLYNLFQNAGYTTAWNELTTYEINSTSAAAITLNIYASIPPEQNDAPVGNYTDTVTITTNY